MSPKKKLTVQPEIPEAKKKARGSTDSPVQSVGGKKPSLVTGERTQQETNFPLDSLELNQVEETIRSLARFPAENPNPVLRIAHNGNLLYANEAAQLLLTDWKLTPGEPAPETFRSPALEVFEARKEKTMEISCGERVFSVSIEPAPRDQDVSLYALDITERKCAEDEARVALIKYKTLFECFPQGITVTDEAGNILETNSAAVRLLGVSEEDQARRGISGIEWKIVRPGGMPMPPEEFASVRALKENRMIENVEMGIVKADNSITWISVNAAPLPVEGYGIVATYGDISKRKQTEIALRESEQKYRLLFDEMSSGYAVHEIMCNPDGKPVDYRFLSVNAAFEKMTGLHSADILGRTVLEVMPAIEPIWIERYGQVALTREPIQFENHASALGKTFEVRAFSPEAGKFATIFLDISERKKSENALRESEELFRQVYDYMEVGVARVSSDFHITSANDAYCRMLGYSEAELVGKHLRDLTHPETIEENLRKQSQLAAGEIDHYRMEKRFIHKDGRVVHGILDSGLIRDAQGNPLYFLSSVLDISERKQAEEKIHTLNAELELRVTERTAQLQTVNKQLESELTERKRTQEALRESDERFRSLSEATFEAINIHDEGVLLDANEQYYSMFGYKPDELLGKQVMPLTIASDAIEIVKKQIATSGMGSYEATGLKKDGTRFPIEIRVREMEYKGRKVRVAAIRDITERKRAVEALQQRTIQLETANKELEAFSYSISHDLRSPLRAIDGFSRILLEDYSPQLPPEAQRYLGLVRDNAQQMGLLIEDLLAFSRLGRLSLHTQTVAPTEIVQKVLADLRIGEEQRKIEVTIGKLPDCQADPVLLKQIWFNLLSNAFKFTRKREVARIDVGILDIPGRRSQIADLAEPLKTGILNEKSAIYYVRDNGVGFDMQYANKLFGVFQRLHRAEEYEGTGVGLAIVHQIVVRHGGQVWAEAEVDKGAAFYFTLEGDSS